MRTLKQIIAVTKYDLKIFFSYRTNLIWLVATPLIFALTGFFLDALVGRDELHRLLGGDPSGMVYVLTGYLIFSFANYGWQINRKIEGELANGTAKLNFILPYSKPVYLYGLCLGEMLSSGLVSYVFFLLLIAMNVSSFASLATVLLSIFLMTAIYLGISLSISAFALAVKRVGSLTNILSFALQMVCGMIIPLRVFPKTARTILSLLPTSLSIDCIRSQLLDLKPIFSHSSQLLLLAVYAFVFNIFGFFAVRSAISYSKRKGTLDTY